ncbi:hypothetical protein ES703_35725 [subsurface metagenome]
MVVRRSKDMRCDKGLRDPRYGGTSEPFDSIKAVGG